MYKVQGTVTLPYCTERNSTIAAYVLTPLFFHMATVLDLKFWSFLDLHMNIRFS
jgi:hypothetical protein